MAVGVRIRNGISMVRMSMKYFPISSELTSMVKPANEEVFKFPFLNHH
jgi:hypothetical protein